MLQFLKVGNKEKEILNGTEYGSSKSQTKLKCLFGV
jgi:hypothetical protein